MRFVFTYPCDNGKVGVEAVLFYIFLHKLYLLAHCYKVCVLKYIKIKVVRLRYYFPFYYLCKIEIRIYKFTFKSNV